MSSFDSNKFLSYSIYMEKRHQQRSNSNLLRELENSQQSNVSYHTLVENKAYQWIDDNSVDDQDELTALSGSVLLALKDVVSLTGKLTDSERSLPEGLPEIPRELSFWIASHLGGSVADEQQSLLEMLDTKTRLQREYDMLDQTRRQLAARTALKETLSNADPKN